MVALVIIGWTLAGGCALGWMLTDIRLTRKTRYYNELAQEILRMRKR